MTTGRRWAIVAAAAGVLVVASAAAVGLALSAEPSLPQGAVRVGRPPRIDPDYAGCMIPPNIAPLNFVVKEAGGRFRVRVWSRSGDAFVAAGSARGVRLPQDKWKRLVQSNRGQDLFLDVYAKEASDPWRQFEKVTLKIAREQIDPYVVYRLLPPLYVLWCRLGIYQRNLESFREEPIVVTEEGACLNCHSFINNRPETMTFHMRPPPHAAMVVARDGQVAKVDTRTKFNPAPAAYTSWHPNGRLMAFSANKVRQFFHSVGDVREVFDMDSDLAVYDVDANRVASTSAISQRDRLETFPTWSPDGRWLYFCSTPKWWPEGKLLGPSFEEYKKVRYDLMRIAYDPAAGTWGEVETVLRGHDVGGSINEPRVSPDGRFVLFCVADRGCFPVYIRTSDLHLLDLTTGRHRALRHNSDRSESWHCWSSNSRWIVFASRRRDGQFARLFLSYIGRDGRDHKPLLLPQEDPTFYDSFVLNYNVPELVTGPVRVRQEDLLRVMYAVPEGKEAGVVTGATPKGESRPADTPRRYGAPPGR